MTSQFFIQQKAVAGTAKPAKDGEVTPALFQPLKLREVTFANRVFVSPMCMYSSEDGFATDFHLVHAGQFALRGVGLFMIEASAVEAIGRISPMDLGIWKDDHISGLKRITDFAHSVGGRIAIQLAHAGRKASTWPLYERDGRSLVAESDGGWPDDVVAPSAVAFADYTATPKELTRDEIKAIVDAWGAAAARANKAGFDAVEIHGAHGYLLHEFLSPVSNKRTDEYGGSLENRARFLREVVAAVRANWPAEKPLFLRLSCTDWDETSSWNIDEVTAIVKSVLPLGVDVVDCSTGGNSNQQKIAYGPGFQVPYSEKLKQALPGIRTIAVGAITSPAQANQVVDEGKADFVMMARQFLRESWVQTAAHELGADIAFINQYERGKHL